VKVYVPTASLPLGVKVPVQVMVSPLGAPQLAALKEPPLNPMPPNETSAAVGGVPAPVHDRSAVIRRTPSSRSLHCSGSLRLRDGRRDAVTVWTNDPLLGLWFVSPR